MLRFCFAVLCFAACGVSPAHSDSHLQQLAVPEFTPGGRVGGHGMIVFGDPQASAFFSHIPMFHRPHDVQAIFEVELKSAHGPFDARLFTFNPAPTSIDDLILGHADTLTGTLFDGNFESGGLPLEQLTAKVKRVLHAAPLIAQAPRTPLRYLLFEGDGGRAYLAHLIGRAPGFDQLLSLHEVPASLSAAELTRGVIVEVPGTPDSVSRRVSEGPVNVRLPSGVPLRLLVSAELSCLLGPEFTASCE
jgi:hypothetical protein